jgi:hypothetical protein
MSLSRLFLVAAITVALASCNKKDSDSVAPYGKMTISFSNEVDGQPINMGPLSYTNAAGNNYSVDLLKYYITNVTLVKEDGSEKNFHNYQLIDASNPATLSFTLDSVASASYTSVKFNLGVDSLHNHTGAQEGALDPANGMIWTWSTGYIFFKHEGYYKDSSGATKSLIFHYGTDIALASITVPITKMVVAGDTRKLKLKFDLNSVYTSPSTINFNIDNSHMSTSRDDLFWINAMRGNFSDAFSYSGAE